MIVPVLAGRANIAVESEQRNGVQSLAVLLLSVSASWSYGAPAEGDLKALLAAETARRKPQVPREFDRAEPQADETESSNALSLIHWGEVPN